MKVKLTIYLLCVIFAFLGMGFTVSYFGVDLVSLIHHVTDYITMLMLLIAMVYVTIKIEEIARYVPIPLILLNTGTLALLFLMYFLYDFFNFSTITNALSAIGFNIVSGLTAITVVADLVYLPLIKNYE